MTVRETSKDLRLCALKKQPNAPAAYRAML